jgi:glycosyltransferase involved in cell wall biosynthesis
VEITRVSTLEPEYLKARLEKRWKNNHIISLFMRILLKIFSIIYYRIAIPDLSIGWTPFAYRRAKNIIREKSIDIIYVHNQPPSSLLVGFFLKKKTGIPLVLDYTDPWSTSKHYCAGGKIKRYLMMYVEKKILSDADNIIYCKRSIYEEIFEYYDNLNPDKFIFIPHGYDYNDFLYSNNRKSFNKFRFVYTGKLTNNFCYSPKNLFLALSKLLNERKISSNDIEVVLAGQISNDYKNLINNLNLHAVVHHVGFKSHSECIKYLKSADALFLIIESSKGKKISREFAGSMPAKIFEYLYTGKPVLAIIPPGPEYKILKRAGIGFFAEPNNEKSIKNALLELYHKTAIKKNKIMPDWEFIELFERRKLTNLLSRCFDTLINEEKFKDDFFSYYKKYILLEFV